MNAAMPTTALPSSYWSRLAAMLAPGDLLYRDAHYLIAEMDVDASAAKRWLPPSLRLAQPATASLFTAWFPSTSFGSVYREAGLFLHAQHWRRPALFCPWMIVDDDVALVMGRELCGYPKKLGEIAFEVSGDRVHGVAHRRGSELLHMEGSLGAVIHDAAPFLGRPHRNVRSSLGLALPRLVAFTPREEPLEVRAAELTVRVGGSTRDPLHELGLGRVRAARLHRVNLRSGPPPLPLAGVSPFWFARQLLLRTH